MRHESYWTIVECEIIPIALLVHTADGATTTLLDHSVLGGERVVASSDTMIIMHTLSRQINETYLS